MSDRRPAHGRSASPLTLEAARNVLKASEAEAIRSGTPVSIAIVDGGGHLKLFLRMEGAHLGTVDVALGKARCAVLFDRPTRFFAEALAAGATGLTALPGVVPFAGGAPLIAEDHTIGAIGVSGAAPEQDEAVSKAGASALAV